MPKFIVYDHKVSFDSVWSENKIVEKLYIPDNLAQNIWDAQGFFQPPPPQVNVGQKLWDGHAT